MRAKHTHNKVDQNVLIKLNKTVEKKDTDFTFYF